MQNMNRLTSDELLLEDKRDNCIYGERNLRKVSRAQKNDFSGVGTPDLMFGSLRY